MKIDMNTMNDVEAFSPKHMKHSKKEMKRTMQDNYSKRPTDNNLQSRRAYWDKLAASLEFACGGVV